MQRAGKRPVSEDHNVQGEGRKGIDRMSEPIRDSRRGRAGLWYYHLRNSRKQALRGIFSRHFTNYWDEVLVRDLNLDFP